MLPYFVSAGHHHYAKDTRIYLQLFDTWKELYPDLVKKFFDEGFHTIRYASRNWSGTWSDMAIEESVMRDAKSSGGLSHGTLRDLDASL